MPSATSQATDDSYPPAMQERHERWADASVSSSDTSFCARCEHGGELQSDSFLLPNPPPIHTHRKPTCVMAFPLDDTFMSARDTMEVSDVDSEASTAVSREDIARALATLAKLGQHETPACNTLHSALLQSTWRSNAE